MQRKMTIPGAPVAKGRPRFTRSGHTYTPDKTRNYEALVRSCFDTQCGEQFSADTPVFVLICAYFPIPQSYPKYRRLALDGAFHLKKPDSDNVAKSILDALNGHAYPDDAAVQLAGVYKIYTNAAPRVEVLFSTEGFMYETAL